MNPNLKSITMKKLLVVLLGVALTTVAMAQTEIKEQKKDLKNTIKDKKMDKHDAAKDMTKAKVTSAKEKREEVRAHRKSIHRQVRHLKNEGVEHPKRNAQRAAKRDKDAMKGKN